MARFWQSRFDHLEDLLKRKRMDSMTNTATEALCVVVEREIPYRKRFTNFLE